MKFATILLFWLMVHTSWASAQTPQSVAGSTAAAPSAEEEIKTLEEMRNQAVLCGDIAAPDRMTSDDYTFITLRGEMRTKAEILKGFASGSFHYELREISDLKVRIYEDTTGSRK